MRDVYRKRESELLLEAIGEINDSFIFEAESYQKKKASAPLWRKLVIAAVALSVVFTLTLSVGIGLMLGGMSKDEDNAGEMPTDAPPTDAPDKDDGDAPEASTPTTLDGALIGLKRQTQSFSSPLEREMLFDGEAKLIWKYSDEEDYRICEIASAIDAEAVKSYVSSKRGFTEAAPSDEEGEIDGFWVCFGDGLVYTPYLKSSSGNVGYGDVFDYENELEPSADFAELIDKVISEASN